MRSLQLASLRSGFGCHINQITDGSIVTSSVTFCKYMRYVIMYMRYVIATRKKPYLFIYEAQCCLSTSIYWTVWNINLCKIEIVSLFLGVF